MNIRTASLAALMVAGAFSAATPAFAEVINLTAQLTGAAEVPATDSAGKGTLEGTFDTETMALKWNVTYEGLTGDATAAHFHGPADDKSNAGPVVPIEGALTSPIAGEATLNAEQAQQLQDGMWYFNIHTAAHPDGEIRGQVSKAVM